MFCNVLHDEKREIRDLISDLLAWKSENLFTVPIPVLASRAVCTRKNINNSAPLFPTSTFFWVDYEPNHFRGGGNQAITHSLMFVNFLFTSSSLSVHLLYFSLSGTKGALS